MDTTDVVFTGWMLDYASSSSNLTLAPEDALNTVQVLSMKVSEN